MRGLFSAALRSAPVALHNSWTMALRSSGCPSIVVVFLKERSPSGIEAFRRLRAEQATRGIPIMAMTASVMTSDRQRITDAGFDAFQSKPIKVKDLSSPLSDFSTILEHEERSGRSSPLEQARLGYGRYCLTHLVNPVNLFADLEEFVQNHRPHRHLTADATEPAWDGYLLPVACPCRVVSQRWVTPLDADGDLIAGKATSSTAPS
jgi:CheY-like chemotaxis protein